MQPRTWRHGRDYKRLGLEGRWSLVGLDEGSDSANGLVVIAQLYTTTSIPDYNSFDFFDPKFGHSFYSKNLYKYCQI